MSGHPVHHLCGQADMNKSFKLNEVRLEIGFGVVVHILVEHRKKPDSPGLNLIGFFLVFFWPLRAPRLG